MLSFLITLATLVSNTSTQEVRFKALCLNQPEVELAILDAKGQIETFKVYAHTLTTEKITSVREGKITLLGAEVNSDGKTIWVPRASANIPPTLNNVIIILTGDPICPKVSIVADGPEKLQGGSLRFFNTCPYAIGISLPGLKKILLSGSEVFFKSNLLSEGYGQGQFFTSNQNGGWRHAGGMRWLQLNDSRTLWFIAPDPNNFNLVTIHGIEEPLSEPINTPVLKTNSKNTISRTHRQF